MYKAADVCADNVVAVILWCIHINDMSVFYLSSAWERLRSEVMEEFKWECQPCKTRGYYRRATTVHHVKYVRLHPALALSKYYIDGHGQRQRQLLPVCADCHRRIHNGDKNHGPKFSTEERWD